MQVPLKHPDAIFTVLAIYGLKSSVSALSAFYELALSWMAQFDVTPDTLVVEGKGFSGRAASFVGMDRKIRGTKFKNIEWFELGAIRPRERGSNRDYMLRACWNSKRSYAYIGGAIDAIGDSAEVYRPLITKLATYMQSGYGIVYSRPRSKGPFYYAVGINQNSGSSAVEFAAAVRTTRWSSIGIDGKVWERGYVRDVFQWSILNDRQLLFPVGVATLGQWVVEHAWRGRLDAISPGVSLWQVEPKNLARVENGLTANSYIAGWQTF